MGNKSLIANWIAKCDQELEIKCKVNECQNCKYWGMCMTVLLINKRFKDKGYLK